MTTETITEYETTEKKVQMAICDECGKDVGPVDDEDTHIIPVLANPQFDYEKEHIINTVAWELRSAEWAEVAPVDTGVNLSSDESGRIIEPVENRWETGDMSPSDDGWVKWGAVEAALERRLPAAQFALDPEAEALRELCPNCAGKHGFEVDEDGSISAMTIRTPEDDADADDELEQEAESYQQLQQASERFGEIVSIGLIVGGLTGLLWTVGVVTPPLWAWAAMFTVTITALVAQYWTDPLAP